MKLGLHNIEIPCGGDLERENYQEEDHNEGGMTILWSERAQLWYGEQLTEDR